ncbi:MAG TPA: helix-turn-helix domain-containing protein [Ohtaekwangia sp.]|uniref:helix-turn-helix domain-containing protein n=1 Tax=Ohtaekwangia sp. TaxID=2066019 RepID=UPI002F957502
MENGIYLSGMSKSELKNLLREILTDILKERTSSDRVAIADILDVKEAAAFLRSKVTTLYEKTSAKIIPHFKKGNKLYFRRHELEAWIENGKVKTVDELQSEAVSYRLRKK